MRIFFRILILFVVVPATYYFFYWVPFSIIPFLDHRWIANVLSLICAVGAGWYVWRKIGAVKDSLISDIVMGALVLGGASFLSGFLGPIILTPNANQGPLLGIFITGPAGLIIGAILGFVIGKIKSSSTSSRAIVLKMWTWLLWSCGLVSAALIAGVLIYVPCHESKYSNIIERPADLNKRDSTLKSLRVRSLSDDDLVQLKKFEYLNHLDFYAGWGVEEAKLTDIGLKNLSEIKLSRLEWLMLGSCKKISDEGLKYVSHIQTLKYLSLVACPQITDIGLANLATSNSIETIDLRGCAGVSDKGLRYLIKMPQLKEVLLGGCTNITAAGVDELRRVLPKAKIVKDDQEWAMHIK